MSNNIKDKSILIIGAGLIAQEYAKILKDIGCKFTVVGRGRDNSDKFYNLTGIPIVSGGVGSFISANMDKFDAAIVAVGIESLAEVTKILLNTKIKNILIEKPGGNSLVEISEVANLTRENNANVLLAYNRRFYSSVIRAKKIIKEDGGVSSFNFEFTEWGHEIEKLPQAFEIKQNWFMANSSHVIDMAFYLGGFPDKMTCFTSGELSWHKPAVFSGAGISKSNAVFSYNANWKAPGRWGAEILTNKHRLIFRPLEKLQIQKKGSVEVSFLEIDNSYDIKYKPGFHKQISSFLSEEYENFCTIEQQKDNMEKYYIKMLGVSL